ncbi:biotin--protein ligase [Luteimonas sp. A501]
MDTTGNTAHGEYKVPGGKLVVVDLAIVDGRMAAVQVSGDFFLEPASALDAIDAALEGQPIDTGEAALAAAVTAALGPAPQLFGITPEGVAIAVRRALDSVATDAAMDAGEGDAP